MSGCAVEHAAFVHGVNGEPDCFALRNLRPVGWLDVVFFANSIVGEEAFLVTGQIRDERTSDVAVEWDCDAAQRDGFVAGLGCALRRARRGGVIDAEVEAGEAVVGFCHGLTIALEGAM